MKNLIPVLAILLSVSSFAADTGEPDPRAVAFKLPEQAECLQMISHVRCLAWGHAQSQANCSVFMSFRSKESELIKIEVGSHGSHDSNTVGLDTPFRVIFYFVTLSTSESFIADNSG